MQHGPHPSRTGPGSSRSWARPAHPYTKEPDRRGAEAGARRASRPPRRRHRCSRVRAAGQDLPVAAAGCFRPAAAWWHALDQPSFFAPPRRDVGDRRRVGPRANRPWARCVIAAARARRGGEIRFAGADLMQTRPARPCGPIAPSASQMVFQGPRSPSLNPGAGVDRRHHRRRGPRLHGHAGPDQALARTREAAPAGRARSGGDRTASPHEFSGGQRQRIAIRGRALGGWNPKPAGRPDEPVLSALDVSVQAAGAGRCSIRCAQRLGLSMVFITPRFAASPARILRQRSR